MWTIKQPPTIIFGKNSAKGYSFPKKCLIITSKGAISRDWLDYVGLNNHLIFDEVEPNPSIETTEKIITKFQQDDFTHVVGLGGGSSMDVAKYCAFKMKKQKIMIPTTFGSGSEVTRISVLKVNGEKKSFHDDNIFADVSIIDPFFVKKTPFEIIKNSAIDACAQCSEAYDSKLSNNFTKMLCKKAFDILENAILDEKYEDLAYGAMISGLGFGNSSTTLGHALSYVFSNEGISHGHALAFTTTISHKFNNSEYYERFMNLVKKLKFSNIHLKGNLNDAAELILTDKKHLNYNPKLVSKNNIVDLLELIQKNKII